MSYLTLCDARLFSESSWPECEKGDARRLDAVGEFRGVIVTLTPFSAMVPLVLLRSHHVALVVSTF